MSSGGSRTLVGVPKNSGSDSNASDGASGSQGELSKVKILGLHMQIRNCGALNSVFGRKSKNPDRG